MNCIKKWPVYVGVMLFTFYFPLFTSCSEETKEEGEFDNWQEQNEAVLTQWAANGSFQKIITYTKNADFANPHNTDYIYVEVLETGSGTVCPLYTDTVRVAYRGHYIPTASYPEGLVFDQTYIDDFDWSRAGTTVFSPSTSGLRDGFATALMNMHVGDRWRVRMPYSLGYGTSDYTGSGSTIPGYSNLVFEIAVYDFWHPGETRPAFKSR